MYLDAHLHIEKGARLILHPAVWRVFLNSTCPDDYPSVASASKSADVISFFGLHPWKVADSSIATLEETLASFPAAAIGESGLDSGPAYKAELPDQITAFKVQLKLASKLERPMSIHCVKAWQHLFNCLDEASPLPRPFILHSFYGSAEVLQRLLNYGAYISISSLSLRNPEKSHPVIIQIPTDRLLIETDMISGSAGYTPESHLQELKNNYNVASSIFRIPESELIQRIWENGTVFTN